jgi:hypothetical protein
MSTVNRVRTFLTSSGSLVLIVLVGAVVFSQCDARHKDVSHDPQYASRVGQACTVLKGLRAHGLTRDLRTKATLEVAVTTLPGIDGPEITFKTPIPKGTVFRVTSVRECWNCPFDRISYGVSVPTIPELAAHNTFARPEALEPTEAECNRP